MQFEDTTHSPPASPVAAPPTGEILNLTIADVVVDMSAGTKQHQQSAHQMLYVDISWRSKKFRTVASARDVSGKQSGGSGGPGPAGSATTASFTSSNSSGGGDKVVLTNRGPLTDSEQDVLVVTLRRCEIFGDADLNVAAFRLNDVPFVRGAPIVVKAGPFMLSLQPENFGEELPPELTLAERIDAVGPPVGMTFSTGDRARSKVVGPISEECLARKRKLRGANKAVADGKMRGAEALADGTATTASAIGNKRLDGHDKDDDEDDQEKSAVAVVAEQQKKNDDENEQQQQQVIPAEVEQILAAQVPPPCPLLAPSLEIELELGTTNTANNSTDSQQQQHHQQVLPSALNASAPALAEAARLDVHAKLQRKVQESAEDKTGALVPYTGGKTLAERVAAMTAQKPMEPLPVIVEVKSLQLISAGKQQQQSPASSSSIVLNLALRADRAAPVEAVEAIREMLASGVSFNWSPDDFPMSRTVLIEAIAQQQLEDKNQQQQQQQQQQRDQSQPSNDASGSTTTTNNNNVNSNNTTSTVVNNTSNTHINFASVFCNKLDVARDPMSADQQAEQQRILVALERRPLQVFPNPQNDPRGPLMWRGTLPDERCPPLSLHYRRNKYAVAALVSVGLLPLVTRQQQQTQQQQQSSGATGFLKNMASKVSTAVSGAVEKATSRLDSERLLSDFPEVRTTAWAMSTSSSSSSSSSNTRVAVAEVYECQALSGTGTPVTGKLYFSGNEIFFHAKDMIHFRASLAEDVVCIRRVVSFGQEAFQVFVRGGTVMQFSVFDGFFARLSMSIGLRSFTKFFEAWQLCCDLWWAQRMPVSCGRLEDD